MRGTLCFMLQAKWTPRCQELVMGQGGLVFCSPWGRKESDMTERLN